MKYPHVKSIYNSLNPLIFLNHISKEFHKLRKKHNEIKFADFTGGERYLEINGHRYNLSYQIKNREVERTNASKVIKQFVEQLDYTLNNDFLSKEIKEDITLLMDDSDFIYMLQLSRVLDDIEIELKKEPFNTNYETLINESKR